MSEGANVNITRIQRIVALPIQGGVVFARRVVTRVSVSRSAPAAVEAPKEPAYALQVRIASYIAIRSTNKLQLALLATGLVSVHMHVVGQLLWTIQTQRN